MIKTTYSATQPLKALPLVVLNRLFTAILCLFLYACTHAQTAKPVVTGQQAQTFSHQVTKIVAAHYLLYLPQDYNQDSKQRWPLIIFLHGSGERGDDLSKVKIHGVPKITEKYIKNKQNFPFIVVSPQVSADEDWDVDTLDALLDDVLERLPIDRDRVYLTGLSLGGHATWRWASQRPERFAAIAPVCGAGTRSFACHLTHVPVWAFHGDQDSVVPYIASDSMVKAVQACGGNAQLTTYIGGGHDAWTETYDNQKLYDWFLQHKRFAPKK
ncbi:MAG: phospholipase [Methylotenera sp.]|nr:phospholipase [Methylotenera sp.]